MSNTVSSIPTQDVDLVGLPAVAKSVWKSAKNVLVDAAKKQRQGKFYRDNVTLGFFSRAFYGLERVPGVFRERPLLDQLAAVKDRCARESSELISKYLFMKSDELSERGSYS